MPRTFTLASRPSPLARVQTNGVVESLQELFASTDDSSPKFQASFVASAGDKNQSQALYLIGGKELWTGELQAALKAGQVDMLVHCLKDTPTTLPEGCTLGAILEREDPVDSLVVKQGLDWKTLDQLPDGSVIGTGSVRRIAQLKRKYPHLRFSGIRGNIDTRLSKLDAHEGPYVALILAKAGLVRLGLSGRISSDIGPPTLYYAVSQGALAIEVRSDDLEALELCKRIGHRETAWICSSERACLRYLEGGCSVPIGITSKLETKDTKEVLTLTGCVTGLDGTEHVECTISGVVASLQDAEMVGVGLAKMLVETGAKKILDDINLDRNHRIVEAQVAERAENA